MAEYSYRNELIDNYVREFQSRIVSETGIESDKYHLGKIILQSLKDDPDFVMQIDGGTGLSETNKSMLRRSIQCANSLKNLGIKTGDTMVLMAPNHLDLAVPFYAALYQGIATAAIDRTLLVNELKDTFDIIKPKVIFCQSEKVQDVQKALELLRLESTIISFDKSPDTTSLSEILEKHGNENDVENFRMCTKIDISETSLRRILRKDLGMTPYKIQLVQELKPTDHPMRFRFAKWACDRLAEDADFAKKIIFSDEAHFDLVGPADFDPDETIAYLVSTSGTTGLPKATILTHKNMMTTAPAACSFATKLPPTRSVFISSPLQWLTAILNYIIAPLYKYTRIQSSHVLTMDHTLEVIRKYKPTFMIISPTIMTHILKAAKRENCDLSCYETILLGGSAVPKTLVEELKEWTPNTLVADLLGMSEAGSIIFHNVGSPLGSCGVPFAHLQYKLVDIETGDEINEPNKRGELWYKTPGGFKGYYNNQEATAEALSKDGWFKTGDMMYRDENWNFYYVERIKLLLKYMNHQISPVELEGVIRQHPAVLDVAVTSLPDPECGDLPVACVVPRQGFEVTAEEIQDMVKEKLTDTKHLRGGVIFLEELPLTASTKVHRRKLKEIALARAAGQVSIKT